MAAILVPQRFRLAEEVRNQWVVNAEEGVTLQQVMEPEYWAHISTKLRPYDHIEVRLETGEWVAQLLVIASGQNWTKVHLLNHYDLVMTQDAPPESQRHEIKWRGPQLKWCVVRLSDRNCLMSGLEKAGAVEWLQNHEKVTAP